jgi:Family of unknown function (DUF6314)
VEPDVPGRYHDDSAALAGAQSIPDRDTSDKLSVPGDGPLIPDALDFLRGGWRIERRIIDYAGGDRGTFDGAARFEPLGAESGLSYREAGELRFGEYRGPASRSLIYRGCPDGTADVFFADGREFYHLDPRSGRWTGQHPCGPDHYVLAGRRLGNRMFEERWRVRGPDTDYEIITTLVRE